MNPADLIAVFDEYLKKSGAKKNYIADKLKELFESATSPLNPDGKPMEALKENMKNFNKKLKDFKFPSMYAFNVALQGALKSVRDFRDTFKNSNLKNFMKVLGNLQASSTMKGGGSVDLKKAFSDMNANLRKIIRVLERKRPEAATRGKDPYSPYYEQSDNFIKRYLKLMEARSNFERNQNDRKYVRGESGGFFSSTIGKIVGAAIAFSVVYYLNENLNKTTRGMALKELVKNFIYNVFSKTMDILASPETANAIIKGGGIILKTLATLIWNIIKITFTKIGENAFGMFKSFFEGKFGESLNYFSGAIIAAGLGLFAILRVWAIGKFIPGVNLIFSLIEAGIKKIAAKALRRMNIPSPSPTNQGGGSRRRGGTGGRRGRPVRLPRNTRTPPVPSSGFWKSIADTIKKYWGLAIPWILSKLTNIFTAIKDFFQKQFFKTIINVLGQALRGIFSVLGLKIAAIVAATYFAGKGIYESYKSIQKTNEINAETQENAAKWNKQNKDVLSKQEESRDSIINQIAKKQNEGTTSEKDLADKRVAEYRNKMSQNLKAQSDLNEAVAKRSTFFRSASDAWFGTKLTGETTEQAKERQRLFEENRKLDEMIREENRKQKSLETPQQKQEQNKMAPFEVTPLIKKDTKPSPFVVGDKTVEQDTEKVAMENAIRTISDKLDMLASVVAAGTESIRLATTTGSGMVVQAVAANSGASVNVASSDPISDYRKRADRAI
jgi:hypothetical protein